MHWTKLPYWLRWGIILGVFMLIFTLISIPCEYSKSILECGSLAIPLFPPVLLMYIVGAGYLVSYSSAASIVIPIVSTIFWFIIGSIIGAIIEDVKSRKKPAQ
jgi:hypothetical protein